MRIVPVKGMLSGGGLKCPPEPFIEVDDADATALIKRGLAKEYRDGGQAAAPAAAPVTPAPVVTTQEPAATPEVAASENDPGAERLATLVDHIELLTEDDFVKTGARAGKPKVKPLADALGWDDLTVEEVDAAFAAKEAGGQ